MSYIFCFLFKIIFKLKFLIMKKTSLILCLAACCAIFTLLHNKETKMSNLLLSNAEALANWEGGWEWGEGPIGTMDCYFCFSDNMANVWYNSCSNDDTGISGEIWPCGAISHYEPRPVCRVSTCYINL